MRLTELNPAAGRLCDLLQSTTPELLFDAGLIRAMGEQLPDIPWDLVFQFNLLTPLACQLLIEAVEATTEWHALPGDDYAADECRLFDFAPALDQLFRECFCALVNPLLSQHYAKYQITPDSMEPPFVIRYVEGSGVQDMDVHSDGMSLVTFSVPLNDGFTGSGLFFARDPGLPDGFTGPPGRALCFPGGPTHEHYVPPITSGRRYTLTIWTRGC